MHSSCPDCHGLFWWGVRNKAWQPQYIPEVAAKIMEVLPGIEQRRAFKGAVNKLIRYDTHNNPKRLLRNADLGIPPAIAKRKKTKKSTI